MLDLVNIWLDLTMQCVGSRGEEPRVILDLSCWILFVFSIGSSNVLFVRSNFGLNRVA